MSRPATDARGRIGAALAGAGLVAADEGTQRTGYYVCRPCAPGCCVVLWCPYAWRRPLAELNATRTATLRAYARLLVAAGFRVATLPRADDVPCLVVRDAG